MAIGIPMVSGGGSSEDGLDIYFWIQASTAEDTSSNMRTTKTQVVVPEGYTKLVCQDATNTYSITVSPASGGRTTTSSGTSLEGLNEYPTKPNWCTATLKSTTIVITVRVSSAGACSASFILSKS